MCGIAGILTREADGAASGPAVARMLRAIEHRGPDDRGTWQSPSGQASFSHARLSILDLSAAGHQPMSTPDGRFTIVFNGEIYNFRALRKALEQRGAVFQTRSDTEVILRAYEAEGPQCVSQLRGMFAFALWDERERTCLLARDRFGIKPLYYSASPRRLVFASEMRGLLASRLVSRDLDPQGVYGYFRSGSVAEPRTLLRDARCLEAGQLAIWRAGTISSQRYWQIRFDPPAVPEADPVAATRRALVDSVAHHFVSDTKVGIFLSGGIDSTALVALARDATAEDLQTFSLTFPGLAADEGELARQTARRFGTTHTEWAIDGDTGRELFQKFLDAADQPSIDGMNTFAAAQLARAHGVKVVLSGIGGDELFGGYPSFTAVPRLARWNRWLSLAGPIRPALGRAVELAAPNHRWRRVGDAMGEAPTLRNAYTTFRGIFTRAESRQMAARYCGVGAAGEAPESDADGAARGDPRDQVCQLEFSLYTRNQLLRDADAMSMAWGLEIRVPFLDGPLVDMLTGIPAAIRLRPHKHLLLSAVPEIPSWVTERPKQGFMFPFEYWLKDNWRDIFSEIGARSPVPLETWYRKWCVFALESWMSKIDRAAHV